MIFNAFSAYWQTLQSANRSSGGKTGTPRVTESATFRGGSDDEEGAYVREASAVTLTVISDEYPLAKLGAKHPTQSKLLFEVNAP